MTLCFLMNLSTNVTMRTRFLQKRIIKLGGKRTLKFIGVAILISTIGFHVARLGIVEEFKNKELQEVDIQSITDSQNKDLRNMDIHNMSFKNSGDMDSQNIQSTVSVKDLRYVEVTDKQIKAPSKTETLKNANRENLILIYKTPLFLKKITKTMHFSHCNVTNCRLTDNVNLMNISKAVIFHGRFLPEVAPFKFSNQIWVFLELESPYYIATNYTFPDWCKAFDLTMTYRSDSDIFYPYGQVIPKDIVVENEQKYKNILNKKERLAAWMVSHCGAVSRRDDYAKRIQKYIPVDIYGRCGTFNCTKNTLQCYKQLSSKYKFYFAFENSLCEDYYTEKIFFNYYSGVDMVAVVRGAKGYYKYFPQGTYIDTADFNHPKDLANYLLDLNSNNEKYLEYLKRKNRYKVIANLSEMFKKSLCKLCHMLNNKHSRHTPSFDIADWIRKSRCEEPSDVL